MNLEKEILKGKIFIYPTDTVYGLGCNALNKKSVEKIKNIKGRDRNKSLSIIVPSLDWIREHCIVNVDLEKYLPGPYTLILKKKDKNFLKWISPNECLGVRIPKSDFCDKIRKTKVPFVTTSANLSGKKPASCIKDIPKKILNQVDFIIDGGKLKGKPSILIIDGKESKR